MTPEVGNGAEERRPNDQTAVTLAAGRRRRRHGCGIGVGIVQSDSVLRKHTAISGVT